MYGMPTTCQALFQGLEIHSEPKQNHCSNGFYTCVCWGKGVLQKLDM